MLAKHVEEKKQHIKYHWSKVLIFQGTISSKSLIPGWLLSATKHISQSPLEISLNERNKVNLLMRGKRACGRERGAVSVSGSVRACVYVCVLGLRGRGGKLLA